MASRLARSTRFGLVRTHLQPIISVAPLRNSNRSILDLGLRRAPSPKRARRRRRMTPLPSVRWAEALLKTLSSPLRRRTFTSGRNAGPSAFDHNLLRLLRNEITHLVDYRPPSPPPHLFKSFSVDPHPGEQLVRLVSRRSQEAEEVKVDATMFDGTAGRDEADLRLHISLVVEVSKGDDDAVLAFVCSAWPYCIEVQRIFPIRRRAAAVSPYMGRDFKQLDGELQGAVYGYLKERGVDGELAEFLHEFVENKDKGELIQWMGTVERYVQK